MFARTLSSLSLVCLLAASPALALDEYEPAPITETEVPAPTSADSATRESE